jgi:hypothetical protein
MQVFSFSAKNKEWLDWIAIFTEFEKKAEDRVGHSDRSLGFTGQGMNFILFQPCFKSLSSQTLKSLCLISGKSKYVNEKERLAKTVNFRARKERFNGRIVQ